MFDVKDTTMVKDARYGRGDERKSPLQTACFPRYMCTGAWPACVLHDGSPAPQTALAVLGSAGRSEIVLNVVVDG
jgi:hypothetical protein